MPSASYGSVPFKEQIAFFQKKLNIPTRHWADVYGQEHDWGFMVAGANRNALLQDFRQAVETAISTGQTLEQFRSEFDNIVAKYGWDYNGGRNWRSRVIYETNLVSSYNAGRFEQLWADKETLPYWQYHHNDAVSHPRPVHLKWNGTILPATHPWWKTHFTPNGWGCQCYITGMSEFDMQKQGLTVSEAPDVNLQTVEIGKRSPNGPRRVQVPEGIDPGFEYTPGRSRVMSAVPPEVPEPPISGSGGGAGLPNTRPSDVLPPARTVSKDLLLPTGLSQEEYATAFLEQFGASLDNPVIYTDIIGERLAIGDALFTDRKSGLLKADKNGRGKYLNLLAQAIREPDEIWVRLEWHHVTSKAVIRRRYVAQFQLPDQDVPALAVFELGPDGWSGITVFQPDTHDIDDLRIGVRLYRRK